MIAVQTAPYIGVQIGTNSAYILILHLNRTQMPPPPHCPKPEIPLEPLDPRESEGGGLIPQNKKVCP